jgi:hypothetical protein
MFMRVSNMINIASRTLTHNPILSEICYETPA